MSFGLFSGYVPWTEFDSFDSKILTPRDPQHTPAPDALRPRCDRPLSLAIMFGDRFTVVLLTEEVPRASGSKTKQQEQQILP